jgi:hypothetical protein
MHTRDVVGDLTAVVATHEVQAHVQARRHAGRRQHIAVVDEQHPGVEPHLREERLEFGGALPVRRGATAVQQTRCGEDEGPDGDRDHARAACSRCDRVPHRCGQRSGLEQRAATRWGWHDERVGAARRAQRRDRRRS